MRLIHTALVAAAALGATCARARPSCFVMEPPFIGAATALRLEPAGDGTFRADAEIVFLWHGFVCDNCIGAGNYPEVFGTFAGITRARGDDGVDYKGPNFSLLGSGDAVFTTASGQTQKGKVFPAQVYPGSTYCD